jgi:hypothetical protein
MKKVYLFLVFIILIVVGGCGGSGGNGNREKAGIPIVTPKGGEYLGSVEVTIETDTKGAEIRYTTDESEPTKDSMLYTTAIKITKNTTLKVKSFKDGMDSSDTVTEVYLIKEVQLDSIEVVSLPTKTSYYVGETLDITGLEVKGIYSDGTKKTENIAISDVKGFDSSIAGTKILTVIVGEKSATFTVIVTESSVELTKIEVVALPAKSVYYTGEEFEVSGLTIKMIYSDGTTNIESVGIGNISGFESATAGEKTLTVTLSGKTTTFNVVVKAVELTKIEIATLPTKTSYKIGETLDITGLVVKGIYSDGTTKIEKISINNVSGFDSKTAGTKTLKVIVGEKSITFTVIVTEAKIELSKIEVTTLPTKTSYYVGESLEIAGMVVKGTYNNGNVKTETVTAGNVTGFNSAIAGTKALTVTLGGKTATFNVTVNAVELTKIEVTTLPTKTSYYVGETLDISGLVVKGTYNNGSTKIETVTIGNVTGFNSVIAGTKILTVTVGGKSDSFTVTVKVADITITRKKNMSFGLNVYRVYNMDVMGIKNIVSSNVKYTGLTGDIKPTNARGVNALYNDNILIPNNLGITKVTLTIKYDDGKEYTTEVTLPEAIQ